MQGELEGQQSESHSESKWEMMNRAVHAAASGGNLEILKKHLGDCSDVLVYREAQGSTVLHAAAGRGQVVKDLITCYDIMASRDYQGNTTLHVAAFRGYFAVAEILILVSPSLASFTNNYGDTSLHMAVSGFQNPVNIKDVANVKNNDVSDVDAMTPLYLLKQQPRSASSETLIKQLISAAGISCHRDNIARKAIVSHLNGHGIGMSPGTYFRIPDAVVFLYTGIGNESDASCDHTSGENSCLSDPIDIDTGNSLENKKIRFCK
ncbi:hypothetical protein SADUNF_Sadunf10G0050600 [Salix dunnii]|uniref:Uncharacterized protein n=1 Tax=Salix dunnii TaxID=1413687 RepID=A0A835JPT2_9ROSI|nr:hypothetical protein SADUNF_Sadunf10G0050600 [Salix dunnii]